jgi:hypothetical protein
MQIIPQNPTISYKCWELINTGNPTYNGVLSCTHNPYRMKLIFKSSLFISGMAVSALFSACTKEPEPCFVIDSKSSDLKKDSQVEFNATCSKDADTYVWDFGDGTGATGSTVSHKFTEPGSYMVLMTTSNKKQAVTTSRSVVITP